MPSTGGPGVVFESKTALGINSGKKIKVALIGSGNWGTAIATVCGRNTKLSPMFDDEVKMWVYEEIYQGRKLTEIINSDHINTKYMPGIQIPPNVVAVPDLKESAKDADVLIFVLPHQFIRRTCQTLKGHVKPSAIGISLIKGFEVKGAKITLMSDLIKDILGIDCLALSGANVAKGVAAGEFSESTIGYNTLEQATAMRALFDTPYFRINCVPDPVGVQLCGSLKNIVAIASGFCDGLGQGTNTKSAIMRIGFKEMAKFSRMFFDGISEKTFWDSAGMADLITTCFGGRNRKCAEAYVQGGANLSWDEIERKLLNGQKLQGVLTAKEVYEFLEAKHALEEFPLFVQVHKIAAMGKDPKTIVECFMSNTPRPILNDVSKL